MIREVNPDFCAWAAAFSFSAKLGGEPGVLGMGLELRPKPLLLPLFDAVDLA